MSKDLDYDTDYFNGVYLVPKHSLDNADLDIGIQELASTEIDWEVLFRISLCSQYVRKLIEDY